MIQARHFVLIISDMSMNNNKAFIIVHAVTLFQYSFMKMRMMTHNIGLIALNMPAKTNRMFGR